MTQIFTTAVWLNPKLISEKFLHLAVTVAVIINAEVIGSDKNLQSITTRAHKESEHKWPSFDDLSDMLQILLCLMVDIYAHKGRQWFASIVISLCEDTLPHNDLKFLFEPITILFGHSIPDSVDTARAQQYQAT